MIVYLLLSFAILFLGFSFVAFEIAYLSVAYPTIYKLTKKKFYIENPAGVLFTILLGVNLFAISYAILNFKFFSSFLSEKTSAILGGIISTIVFVIVSEYLPRLIARRKPDHIIKFFEIFITISYYLFFPINIFLKKLSPRKVEDMLNFYLSELERIGSINPEQKDKLKSMLNYLEMPISNITKSFSEFDVIDIGNFSLRDFKSYIILVRSNGEIFGYVYRKDLLKLDDIDFESIIREPLFLDEKTTIYNAIREMKKHKKNVIFTKNGILTIEDVSIGLL